MPDHEVIISLLNDRKQMITGVINGAFACIPHSQRHHAILVYVEARLI